MAVPPVRVGPLLRLGIDGVWQPSGWSNQLMYALGSTCNEAPSGGLGLCPLQQPGIALILRLSMRPPA